MFKVIGRFVFFVLPVLVVVGLIRVGLRGYSPNAFLPSYADLVNLFSNLPSNTINLVQTSIDSFNSSYGALNQSWEAAGNVTDWNSFWAAVGTFFASIPQFFNMLGSGYVVVISALAVPFEWIGSLVHLLFFA